MAVYCFTQLIQPGKREGAKAIFEKIRETRRSEYGTSRERHGIREGVVSGPAPSGYGGRLLRGRRSAPRVFQEFASSEDPFDEWPKERGQEVYHFEPSETLEADEEVFEAEVG